jgi:hypothetical protein
VLDRLVHGQSSESELRWNEDAFWGFWGKRLAANEGFRTSQDRKDRTSVLACDRIGKWLPQNRSSQTAAISFPHNLLHSQVTREYHLRGGRLLLARVDLPQRRPSVQGRAHVRLPRPTRIRQCARRVQRARSDRGGNIVPEHTLCPRFRRRRARLRPLHREGV